MHVGTNPMQVCISLVAPELDEVGRFTYPPPPWMVCTDPSDQGLTLQGDVKARGGSTSQLQVVSWLF